ncbi:SpaA isopeptide-forming pilin-related protein [Varibaculum vaginae]|uniref:SpaA isopeptide-forming pilin-related protein n=1 Tax=Varibaculum vaginae TaxID=2364797 RepID=UPI000F09873A|nr:SpaA isopeptide-forming pilin-related protein [Varibaculum vaginae]
MASLSGLGLLLSTLLVVVPLTASAKSQSVKASSVSAASQSGMAKAVRSGQRVAGLLSLQDLSAGVPQELRSPAPLGQGAPLSDPRFTYNGTEITGLTAKGKEELKKKHDLTIPDGTTKIAAEVFSGQELTQVTLPASVTEVADRAFYDNQIAELSAPGLKTIGAGAFQRNKLKVFESSTVEEIGDGAFTNNQLETLKITDERPDDTSNPPKRLTKISDNAFRDNQLKTVELPRYVTEIGASAFANNQLSGITLPPNLQKVGQEAFSGNRIDKVQVPKTVTDFGSEVFANNRRWVILEKAEGESKLPDAVSSQKYDSGFGQVAAEDAVSITIKYVEEGSGKPLRGRQILQSEFTEPDGVYFAGKENTIKAPEFAGYEATETSKKFTPEKGAKNEVTFTYKKTDFSPTISGEINKHIPHGDDGSAKALFKGVTAKDTDGKDITESLKVSPEKIDTSVQDAVYDIYYTATDSKGRTKTVKGKVAVGPDWPEQIICPGWQVKDFTYNGGTITGFSSSGKEKHERGDTKKEWCWPTFGDKGQPITEIGDYNFSSSKLTSPLTKLPESWGSITRIGSGAFSGQQITSLPKSWERVTDIGSAAFHGNQLTKLPDSWGSIETLNDDVFTFNKLTRLPDSWGKITKIGKEVFWSNQLQSIPKSWEKITEIGTWAFWSNKLQSLPDSWGNVSKLGGNAFADNQLTSLPNSWGKITSLPSGVFSSNKLVSLPAVWEPINDIGDSAFSSNKLTRLPDSWGNVSKLGENAFSSNQITSLPLYWGKITSLPNFVFASNKIASLPVWGSVKTIGRYAFSENKLVSLPESWEDVASVGVGAFYNNQLEVLPKHWGKINEVAELTFARNQLRSLPASWGKITKIGEKAFNDNQITALPDSWGKVNTLGKEVFYQNQITKIDAPWGLITYIPYNAFATNKITSLPQSWGKITSLGDNAFQGNRLRSLPASWGEVAELGRQTFDTNQLLALPKTWGKITEIPYYCFSDNKLRSLPEDWGEVKEIGDNAFSLNRILTQIPDNWGKVELLGGAVFANADNLKKIPDSWGKVRKIEGGVFADTKVRAPVFTVPEEELERTVKMLTADRDFRDNILYVPGPLYLRPESGKNPAGVASVPGKIIILVDTRVKAEYVDENGNPLHEPTDQVIDTANGAHEYDVVPPLIEGYSLPAVQTVPLDGIDKNLKFVYKPIPAELKNKTYAYLGLVGRLMNEPKDGDGNYPASDTLREQIGNKLRTDLTYGGDAQATLQNGTIRITFDSEKVEFVEAGISPGSSFTSAKVVAPGVLDVKVKPKFGGDTGVTIPIHWRLKKRVTPADGSFPLKATLLEKVGDGLFPVKPAASSQTGPVNLEGYYLMPQFEKTVGCYRSTCRNYTQDDKGNVAESGENAVTFTFGIPGGLFRNVKGITITDQLPVYTKADGSQARAQFNPKENDLKWTQNGDQIIYRDPERTIFSEDASLASVRLHFPGAKQKTRINNDASYVLTPHEAGPNEAPITGQATTDFVFYKPVETNPTGTALDKKADGPYWRYGQAVLFDTANGRQQEIDWTINTLNTTSTSGVVNVEDRELDRRLYYTAVTPDPFFVGGKLEILSPTGAKDQYKVLYSIDISAAGRIELPEELTQKYSNIWLRWTSRVQAEPGRKTVTRIHTRLRDSAQQLCKTQKQDSCGGPLSNQARSGEKITTAQIEVYPEGKTIKALKRNTYETKTVTGKTGVYTVGAQVETDYGEPLTSFQLVDVLPPGLDLQNVAMTQAFASLPGAGYEIVSNWNNTGRTAVVFRANQVSDPRDVYMVGQLETYVSNRVADGDMVNDAFARADGKIREYLNPTEKDPDPVAGPGIWSKAANTTQVSAGSEVYVRKLIRQSKKNATWGGKIETAAGVPFDYQLRVSYGKQAETNPIIYDLLPVAGTPAREGSTLNNQYDSTRNISIEMADGKTPSKWTIQYTCDQGLTKEQLPGANWQNDDACGQVTALKFASTAQQEARSEVRITVPMIAGPKGADPRSQENFGKQGINDFLYYSGTRPSELYSNSVINTLVPPPSNIVLKKTGYGRSSYTQQDGKIGYTLTEKPLAGAKFGLFNKEGVLQATTLSDQDGKVEFREVKARPGWVVRELEAPDGYIISATGFTLQAAHFSDKNFNKQRKAYEIKLGTVKNFSRWEPIEPVKGKVSFKKVDANGNPLAGIEFTVTPQPVQQFKRDEQGRPIRDYSGKYELEEDPYVPNSPAITVRSNTDGEVRFVNLPAGKWQLTEGKTPGLVQPIKPIDFTITRCSKSECTPTRGLDLKLGDDGVLKNDKGRVELVKLGVRGMDRKGKSFGQWQRGDGVVTGGATFKLYKGTIGDPNPREFTTATDGQKNVILDDLELNQVYTLQEVKAPNGYILNQALLQFQINTAGELLDALGQKLAVQDLLAVPNEQEKQKSSLLITKVDPEAETGSKAIADTEFTFYKQNQDGSWPVGPCDPATTDEHGKFEFKAPCVTAKTNQAGQIEFVGLTGGLYKAEETKPSSGYYLTNGVAKTFPVDDYNQQTLTWTVDNSRSRLQVFKFEPLVKGVSEDAADMVVSENKDRGAVKRPAQVAGSFDVVIPLARAKFTLFDSDGKTPLAADLETNREGIVEVPAKVNLDADKTYVLKETKAPDGYIAKSNPISVKISDYALLKGFTGLVTMEVPNTKNTGSVTVSKLAKETGKALAGAKFTLTGPDGTKKEMTTNKVGLATFTGLTFGAEYTLEETQAPDRYRKDAKPIPVKVTGDNPVITVVRYNELAEVEIELNKKDDANKSMEGVVFELSQEGASTPPETLITGTDGKKKFKVFPGQTYVLTEISTNPGYALLPQPVKFEVAGDGKVTVISGKGDVNTVSGGDKSLTVTNYPEGKLPLAGYAGSLEMLLLGCLVLAVAMVITLAERRRK